MATIAHDALLQQVIRYIGSGDELIAGDKPAEALAAFQAALSLKPDDAKIHNKIGLAYRLLKNTDAAIATYERAASLDPQSIVAQFNLGILHGDRGDFEQAVACYRKTLRINPRNVEALRHLARLLAQLGKIEDALVANRMLLALAPDDAETHYRVARLVPHPVPDDDTAAMTAAYERSQPSSEQRKHLALGLGKILEDQMRYGEAFQYFLEGNAIHRARHSYGAEGYRAKFADVKATFNADLFARLAGSGHRDPTPIFIVGMPRSGTSLTEQILASHPRVHGAGELLTVTKLTAEIDPAAAPPERFEEIGRKYVASLRQSAPEASFITDKLPQNFLHIGLIRLALPEAKIIHVRRDPADNCLSIFKTPFTQGHPYAYELTELGRYHNLYRDLMAHWHAVLPGVIYDCDYEQLVHDQEAATRALLAHCGLEWDDACLQFYQTSRKVKTASIGQVHRRIYTSSVDLSRRYGDALAPLLQALEEGSGER